MPILERRWLVIVAWGLFGAFACLPPAALLGQLAIPQGWSLTEAAIVAALALGPAAEFAACLVPRKRPSFLLGLAIYGFAGMAYASGAGVFFAIGFLLWHLLLSALAKLVGARRPTHGQA